MLGEIIECLHRVQRLQLEFLAFVDYQVQNRAALLEQLRFDASIAEATAAHTDHQGTQKQPICVAVVVELALDLVEHGLVGDGRAGQQQLVQLLLVMQLEGSGGLQT